jgi:cysteine desulfurase
MKMKVYLDNGATTMTAKEVVKEMLPYFTQKYGNASSIHWLGLEAKKALDDSRKKFAEYIGANPEEIIFTSGGTEADNIAILGTVEFYRRNSEKIHIITSKIEHPAVLNVCKKLRI